MLVYLKSELLIQLEEPELSSSARNPTIFPEKEYEQKYYL